MPRDNKFGGELVVERRGKKGSHTALQEPQVSLGRLAALPHQALPNMGCP